MESQTLRRIQKEAKLNSWQPDIIPVRASVVRRVAEVAGAAEAHDGGVLHAVGVALRRVARIGARRARAAVHLRADANRALVGNIAPAPARMSNVKCTNSSAAVSKWAAAARK